MKTSEIRKDMSYQYATEREWCPVSTPMLIEIDNASYKDRKLGINYRIKAGHQVVYSKYYELFDSSIDSILNSAIHQFTGNNDANLLIYNANQRNSSYQLSEMAPNGVIGNSLYIRNFRLGTKRLAGESIVLSHPNGIVCAKPSEFEAIYGNEKERMNTLGELLRSPQYQELPYLNRFLELEHLLTKEELIAYIQLYSSQLGNDEKLTLSRIVSLLKNPKMRKGALRKADIHTLCKTAIECYPGEISCGMAEQMKEEVKSKPKEKVFRYSTI